MSEEDLDKVRAAAEEVMAVAEEIEAFSDAAIEGAALENARAILHKWVDTVTGVVNMPGLGRVALIHHNGRQSTISSPDLPFAMSAPVDKKRSE